MDPSFSPMILTVLKHYGLVLAVANIRGGGEFGKEWHLAGCRGVSVRKLPPHIEPFRQVQLLR